MALTKLPIDLSKDYRLKIEKPEELKDSFFKDIYKTSLLHVKDIVNWTLNCLKDDKISDFTREWHEYNNIIAFDGERGTGKSSAMITLANALINLDESLLNNRGLILSDKSYFNNFRFETLRSIDPTRFEHGQNILEVIIAELFQKYQSKLNTKENKENGSSRDVLQAFQEAYKSLQIVSGGRNFDKFDDPLENLSRLAEGTSLEKNLQTLVNKYLKFIHPNSSENQSILIIPIDDFDLNVRYASEMAEQVRKYLMIPQVLILMAVNIEQLIDVKTQDVLNDFKTLYNKEAGMIAMVESPRDVASRYVLKLIPIERRIRVPNIRIERNEVSLFLYDGDIKTPIIPDTDYQEGEKLEKQLLDFIYKHTGLYFVSKAEECHVLIPGSLRELISFATLLNSFKKPDKPNDEISSKQYNLELFEEYFKNTWIKDYLVPSMRRMISDSSAMAYEEWNKYFITSIAEILSTEEKYKEDWKDTKADFFKDNEEIQLIVDRNNYASNVSLGDLNYFIATLDRKYIDDKEIKKLIFSVNCWYSIHINKSYYQKLNTNDSTIKTKKELQNIEDVINGTILHANALNFNNELKLKSQPWHSGIQFYFDFKGSFTKKDKDLLEKFIFINAITKNKVLSYRTTGSVVIKNSSTELLQGKSVTINLFSFGYESSTNIFLFPFYNLEYWQSLIEIVNNEISNKNLGIVDLVQKIFNTHKTITKNVYKDSKHTIKYYEELSALINKTNSTINSN